MKITIAIKTSTSFMVFAVNGKIDFRNLDESEDNILLWLEETEFEFLEDINSQIKKELRKISLPGVFECDFYPPDDEIGQDYIFENFRQLWPKQSLSHTLPQKLKSIPTFILRLRERWKGFFKKKRKTLDKRI